MHQLWPQQYSAHYMPVAVNLMNTVLKRSRKYRIAQNCKITQTVQLTLASLQTRFSLSELAYIYTLYLHNVELIYMGKKIHIKLQEYIPEIFLVQSTSRFPWSRDPIHVREEIPHPDQKPCSRYRICLSCKVQQSTPHTPDLKHNKLNRYKRWLNAVHPRWICHWWWRCIWFELGVLMAPLVNKFLMQLREIIFSWCYYIPKLPKSEKGKRKRYPRTQYICVLSV